MVFSQRGDDINGCGLEECNVVLSRDSQSPESCAKICQENEECLSFGWA